MNYNKEIEKLELEIANQERISRELEALNIETQDEISSVITMLQEIQCKFYAGELTPELGDELLNGIKEKGDKIITLLDASLRVDEPHQGERNNNADQPGERGACE